MPLAWLEFEISVTELHKIYVNFDISLDSVPIVIATCVYFSLTRCDLLKNRSRFSSSSCEYFFFVAGKNYILYFPCVLN